MTTYPLEVNDDSKKSEEIYARSEVIARLDGDEKLCNEILDCFLHDAPVQITNLSQALQQGKINQVAEIAHAIKGASINVGAKGVSVAAMRMEEAAKGKNLGQACLLEDSIKDEFEKLKKLLLKN